MVIPVPCTYWYRRVESEVLKDIQKSIKSSLTPNAGVSSHDSCFFQIQSRDLNFSEHAKQLECPSTSKHRKIEHLLYNPTPRLTVLTF